MQSIRRSALVEHSAARMFDLVNDVAGYPRRFGWCERSEVIESEPERMRARLELGLGKLKTWFTTENRLQRPLRIEMNLVDGPFTALHGLWEFQALDESACKVTLTLEFEPLNRLLAPAFKLGFQNLADRMVDDFVRAAGEGGDAG
ncbi:ubiquinone-binding protein [Pseudoxanthomonas kalamensis DSM 18571]|uniref:type II toxin-antitoxin system RatA family toxin n=1 Tax=Pseudoxanthomonas kalamensis TaxID=289483 RepID=UPI0013909E87|nr:type II toxin-antitoxin system RatA family toxin [Pseudoxanthomonas kalamensis]KAF1709876.1 ubiquinone-binding protein [Pseudoxanthomonas kalamensis DSM 18571]